MELGDLNGDGILDLVTAGYDASGSRFTVRLGAGNGTFGAATSYTMPDNYSRGLTLGDVNGDGKLDVITSRYGAAVRLGRGDGTFGTAALFPTEDGGQSMSVTTGDINGDGKLDIVTGGSNDSTGAGSATVLLGTGSGSFVAAGVYATDSIQTNKVMLGDLNGDGKLDLVTAGWDISAPITVRLGTGTGTFGSVTKYGSAALGILYDAQLADLNGDGFLDLATAGGSGGAVFLGSGSGTLGAALTFTLGPSPIFAIEAQDLNDDGVADLIGGSSSAGVGQATIRMADTVDGVAPLLDFSLATIADARQALSQFKSKLDQLGRQRGKIGASQSRIAVASTILEVSSENFKAAESRIRDADIAAESSRLIRANILREASSSVLAQANQQPALVLKLLN